MILYYGTTMKRAYEIVNDNMLKKDVERHYTKEKSGAGYSSQGYIYFANEITFSVHFANYCNLEDKAESIVIFRLDIPIDKIEPDYDEIRIQDEPEHIRAIYDDDLDYSLREFKSCRVDYDIDLTEYESMYCILPYKDSLNVICENAGGNLEYVIEN